MTPTARAAGLMCCMSEPVAPPRPMISEPRLVLLALLAAAVAVLSIIAIMETDDIWIVVVTIVAVVLVAILLAIDLYRVIDRSAPESRDEA
jgi:cytochrome bd-type quinol oxidase subunit 2